MLFFGITIITAIGAVIYPLQTLEVYILIMYSSIFEWALHKHVMHKRVMVLGKVFDYAYQAHHVIHHGIFRHDDSYHLQNLPDRRTIPMAIWNGPLLVLISTVVLPLPLGYLTGHFELPVISIMAISSYYLTYEYIHWCMHLPKKRRIEKLRFFIGLNGHHLLHHRYRTEHNFNVVLPFADWLLGTLLLRAKSNFLQPKPEPQGPVPDVQPSRERISLPWRLLMSVRGLKY